MERCSGAVQLDESQRARIAQRSSGICHGQNLHVCCTTRLHCVGGAWVLVALLCSTAASLWLQLGKGCGKRSAAPSSSQTIAARLVKRGERLVVRVEARWKQSCLGVPLASPEATAGGLDVAAIPCGTEIHVRQALASGRSMQDW